MTAVIEPAILAAIHARLDRALPGPAVRLRPFVVGDVTAGFIGDARAERLARFGPRFFEVDAERVALANGLRDERSRSAAMADVTRTLRSEGALPGWREELYRVAATFDAEPLLHVERGAARYFGVRTYAAHVNGIVRTAQSTSMWLARRSRTKAVDPGMLDNLVGGGISAGLSVRDTVIKEAWEEAGIEEALGATAQAVGAVHVLRNLPDGLQRETVFVHDLDLPPDFQPVNQDGEATEHRLVDMTEAARTIAVDTGPDEMTVDASVVVLDFLIRNGDIRRGQAQSRALGELRYRGAGDPVLRSERT
jgi:8-oxo-dGTP pyrophosphatase MutT (NUDIX family)